MPATTLSQQEKLERRAEHLAERFGLSLQLTTIWVEQHPKKSMRPMSAKNLKALKEWARV